MGGAVADSSKTQRLNRNQWLVVYLAGVTGNLAIGILCFLAYLPGIISPETWSKWALTQGALILLNLLPLPGLDGGRFLEYFLNPKNVPFEKTLVQRMIGTNGGIFLLFYMLAGILVMPHQLIFIGGWLWRADPARTKRLPLDAIRHSYRNKWAAVYVGLVAASMMLIWLSRW